MVLQTLFKEGLKKASALKMAPHIANNIRRKIIEQEKAWIHPQKLGARADWGNKSVRVSVEVPSESSVDNVVKQYSHLNPKPYTNKKGRSSVTVDAPYEHVKYNPNKLGGNRYLIKEDPYIRQQYPFSSPMSDEFVSKNIDTPFLQQLIDEYGDYTFMGVGKSRLSDPTILRALNLNRKRVAKELGVDIQEMKSKTSGQKLLYKVAPDIKGKRPRGQETGTESRGQIKRYITLKQHLEEVDPTTGVKRADVEQNIQLADDPRFSGIVTPRTSQDVLRSDADKIGQLRKEWGLEVKVNRFGHVPGYRQELVSIVPKKGSRLERMWSLFSQKKVAPGTVGEKRALGRAKRMEYVINLVLDNLSPSQRETALRALERGKSFMNALHESARRDKSISDNLKTPQALSTWYRNLKHFGAEDRITQLREARKNFKGDVNKEFEIDFELAGWDDDMRSLGLQSEIEGVTYGKWYDQKRGILKPLIQDLPKSYPLKQMKIEGKNFKPEGFAAGGIIKSLLPKMSRRKFLKGAAATAASAALPRSALKSTVPTVKSLMERRLSFAPPWVAKMTSALNLAVNKKGVTKLPNGTTVEYIKGPHTKYDSHKLAVKTADGNEDLVNFKETKDSLEIEFDIRDEWHNNQHIYIDKKKKTAELIDENYYMTSPEDYAKDDPIIWDIDKKSLDKTIVWIKASRRMITYMTICQRLMTVIIPIFLKDTLILFLQLVIYSKQRNMQKI